MKTTLVESERSVLADDPPEPDALVEYLYRVWGTWLIGTLPTVIVTGAFAYLGQVIGGVHGQHIGAAIGGFALVVCIVGVLDAAWRVPFARTANIRLKADGALGADALKALKIARLNTGTILLQVAIAAVISAKVAAS